MISSSIIIPINTILNFIIWISKPNMNLWIVYLHLISSFKSDTTVKFRIHESEYVRFHKNVFCNSILLFLKSMPIFRNKLTHKLTFVNSHTSSMWPRRFYWMYEALRSNTVQSTWTLILLSKIMFQLCSVCKWCYFFSLIISHLFCWGTIQLSQPCLFWFILEKHKWWPE